MPTGRFASLHVTVQPVGWQGGRRGEVDEEGIGGRRSDGRGRTEDQEEVKDEEEAMEDEMLAMDRSRGTPRGEGNSGRSAGESRLTSKRSLSLLALFFVAKMSGMSNTLIAIDILMVRSVATLEEIKNMEGT